MELLKQRILEDGRCYEGGILKVDSFINHQMDPDLMKQIGAEFARIFAGSGVNKILTIEASGMRLCRNSVLRRSLSFRSIEVWIFFRRQIFEDYSKIIGSQAVKSVT